MMRRDQETFDRLKESTALPAMVLSVALIPLLVVPLFVDLDEAAATLVRVATILIWLAFALEYALLFGAAPDRRHMFRTHLFELALIVLPMLRPFRAVRVVRLLRAGSGLAVAARAIKTIASRRSLQGYTVVLAVVLVGGAVLTRLAERGQPGSNIESLGDAFWWAFVTSTTVGYGDHYPVTTEGRAIGVVLMFLGIGLLSMVTASIAAYFVDSDDDDDFDQLRNELAEVNRKLDRLLEHNE